jgi:hypothetical protein
MKTIKWLGVVLVFGFVSVMPLLCGDSAPASRVPLDVLEMKAVPDGHYLMNLQRDGAEIVLNIKVQNSAGNCVNTSFPGLKGLEGKFNLLGNGVFLISFRNKEFTMSQYWIFRKDGSAVVKEFPDRGEKESAVPVRDDTLSRGK